MSAVWYGGQRGPVHQTATYTDYALISRVFYTRWCIDTIDSPDDEHWVARNMYRSEINTLKKCVNLGYEHELFWEAQSTEFKKCGNIDVLFVFERLESWDSLKQTRYKILPPVYGKDILKPLYACKNLV